MTLPELEDDEVKMVQVEVADAVRELRERMGTLADLDNASSFLGWDQQTMMPPRGGQARAEVMGTLEEVRHELFVAAETGELLEAAGQALEGADSDSDDVRLVEVMRRRWEKARRVPTELASAMARAASVGQEAWVDARSRNDFAAFAPYLERNFDLARRYVDCFDGMAGFECAYDVLLDDYDPGMRTAQVNTLFAELVAELQPMIVALRQRPVDVSCLYGSFPVERQRALVADVVGLMGYDPAGWRMDDAVHPFASGLGSGDIRITVRWEDRYFASGLFAAMHECGHGLYEQGIADSLQRTPLEHGSSLGLHESQSRMWENMVGRGRPFADALAPRIERRLGVKVTPAALYRAVNRVEPSYIRVEADEATYGLHIVLRFELEQEVLEGRLAVKDLPEAWNARFSELFGIEVERDTDGVLQDVHWAAGIIGYFPTYAVGNLVAGHLWQEAHRQLPDLDSALARGQLQPLREWLRENVHRHGSKFTSREVLERVTGQSLSVTPFVSYLKAKLCDVYDVAL